MRAVELVVAKQDGSEAERAADGNRQEDEAGLLNVEVVDSPKGIRDGSKETKQNAKVDRHIEAQKADDGLGEHHMHWPDKADLEEQLNTR